MKVNVTFIVLLLLALGWMPLHVAAQVTNASITGTVADPTSAVVPNATVTVQNINTNVQQTVQSNNSGIYTVGQLLPGTYRITTDKQGFRRSIQDGVVLTVGQDATLNINLSPGDTKETVEVTADAALINTSTAEISDVVDEHAIKELPLNGRDPSSLVLLTTGVSNIFATVRRSPD